MAITIPGTLPTLATNATLGHMPIGLEPMLSLLRRNNWHYANHSPAVVNVCPVGDVVPDATFELPCPASADALTYRCEFYAYSSGAANGDIEIEESATGGGGTYTPVIGAGGSPWPNIVTASGWYSVTFTLKNTTNFVTVRLVKAGGSFQLQSVLIRPEVPIGAIPAGAQPSGFIPFDDAALTTSGAPIHTEYWERARVSYDAVMADRHQCLLSFAQAGKYPRNLAQDAQETYSPACLCNPALDDRTSYSVTVRVKAANFGAGTGAGVIVGQRGGESTTAIVADGTHRTATLTLKGPRPVLYVTTDPGTLGCDITYVFVTYSPTGTTDAIIGGTNPPPLREYVVALDRIGLNACSLPYAVTGLNFHAALAAGTYWHWQQRIGPGATALWPNVTKSLDGVGVFSAAEFWSSSSGVAPADRIIVQNTGEGNNEVYPVAENAWIDYGGQDDDETPTAAKPRLVEIPESKAPQTETFEGRYLQGFGGSIRRKSVNDIP